MTPQAVFQTILDARALAKRGLVGDAETTYLQAIAELEKNTDSVRGKAELWSTKAEYLWLRSQFFTNGETIEDSRQRKLSAIRLLWRTARLGEEFEERLGAETRNLVKETILSVGCIMREDDSHVHIECPIKIRNMGAGQYGFSVAFFFEKAICSICGRDVIKDTGCTHIPGQEYNGKQCRIKPENLKFDHVAMTTRPKDSKTGLTALAIPKTEVYSNFSEEQVRRKKRFGLPLVCSLCMKEGIDPTEISVKKFFQMQGLSLD
jgi:hypothetical protein